MIPDLYEALSWDEARVAGSGTFDSFSLLNGGVTTWVDLGKLDDPTVKFLLSLRGEIGGMPVDNTALWSWAAKYNVTGITLYNIVRSNSLSDYHVHWPIAVMASGSPAKYPRNRFAMDAYSQKSTSAGRSGKPRHCLFQYPLQVQSQRLTRRPVVLQAL